jgi:hypothetical protein
MKTMQELFVMPYTHGVNRNQKIKNGIAVFLFQKTKIDIVMKYYIIISIPRVVNLLVHMGL